MAPGHPRDYPQHVQGMISRMKGLLNRQLMNVLREEGLRQTGVKAAMQARLVSHIEDLMRNGNDAALTRLRTRLFNPDNIPSPGSSRIGTSLPNTPATPLTSHNGPGQLYPVTPSSSSNNPGIPVHMGARPRFKDTPFFTTLADLVPPQSCPAMQQHRYTVNGRVRLRSDIVKQLKDDPSLRIMLYCAVEDFLGPFQAKVDVAFPHQVELKVNTEEIKANFRGLKNKPGSVRPVDITSRCRIIENYDNSVALTYALTHKRYFFVINLVRTCSVDELEKRLRSGRVITKESVVKEMISRAHDSDIEATSTVMSLKCPLSTLRMRLPCRSMVCTHNQCFDATSFLQLQEQGETWTCPICSKTISFEALVVDQYVKDILDRTSTKVEHVTIEPDGRWSEDAAAAPVSVSNGDRNGHLDDDDDDLLEIRSNRINDLRQSSSTRTPPAANGSSKSEPASRSSNAKRSHDQVIDLTLSDDDEVMPAKRPVPDRTPSIVKDGSFIGGSSASHSGPPNGVQFNVPFSNQRAASTSTGSPMMPVRSRWP